MKYGRQTKSSRPRNNKLSNSQNTTRLQDVLLYHAAEGEVLAQQLFNDQVIGMMNEDNIVVNIDDGVVDTTRDGVCGVGETRHTNVGEKVL